MGFNSQYLIVTHHPFLDDIAAPPTLTNWLTMNEGKTDSKPVQRERTISDTVLQTNPELYINQLGIPCISLPLSDQAVEKSEYSIASQRTRAELASLIYSNTGLTPSNWELSNLMIILQGLAWKVNKTDTGLAEILDSDPLLEATYLFLNQVNVGGCFRGSCTKLAHELSSLALTNEIYTKDSNWPKGIAQLSHRLWKSRTYLKKCGIDIRRGRFSGGQRYIELNLSTESDAADLPASPGGHTSNALSDNRLECIDDGDGAVEELFDRISAPSGENNENPI